MLKKLLLFATVFISAQVYGMTGSTCCECNKFFTDIDKFEKHFEYTSICFENYVKKMENRFADWFGPNSKEVQEFRQNIENYKKDPSQKRTGGTCCECNKKFADNDKWAKHFEYPSICSENYLKRMEILIVDNWDPNSQYMREFRQDIENKKKAYNQQKESSKN